MNDLVISENQEWIAKQLVDNTQRELDIAEKLQQQIYKLSPYEKYKLRGYENKTDNLGR